MCYNELLKKLNSVMSDYNTRKRKKETRNMSFGIAGNVKMIAISGAAPDYTGTACAHLGWPNSYPEYSSLKNDIVECFKRADFVCSLTDRVKTFYKDSNEYSLDSFVINFNNVNPSRYFSCAERKMIFYNHHYHCDDIFVTSKPCERCEHFLKNVTVHYLEGKKIINIKY